MRPLIKTGLLLAAFGVTLVAQDWYHDREERFRGEGWRRHVFTEVKADLEHVWAGKAADREIERLQKTVDELTKMQAGLDVGRWDNGILNDVIDSVRKSSNDTRLTERDREVLAEDVVRLKEFQDEHNRKH